MRWIVVGLALLASLPAMATTLLFVDEVQQARLGTAVVVATVGEATVSEHPRWHRPITATTLRVEEVLWGEAPAQLAVEQVRGTLRGRTTRIPGDPELRPGMRAVFFVRAEAGAWTLTALDLSVLPLRDGQLSRLVESEVVVRGPDGALRPFTPPAPPDLKTLRAALAVAR